MAAQFLIDPGFEHGNRCVFICTSILNFMLNERKLNFRLAIHSQSILLEFDEFSIYFVTR